VGSGLTLRIRGLIEAHSPGRRNLVLDAGRDGPRIQSSVDVLSKTAGTTLRGRATLLETIPTRSWDGREVELELFVETPKSPGAATSSWFLHLPRILPVALPRMNPEGLRQATVDVRGIAGDRDLAIGGIAAACTEASWSAELEQIRCVVVGSGPSQASAIPALVHGVVVTAGAQAALSVHEVEQHCAVIRRAQIYLGESFGFSPPCQIVLADPSEFAGAGSGRSGGVIYPIGPLGRVEVLASSVSDIFVGLGVQLCGSRARELQYVLSLNATLGFIESEYPGRMSEFRRRMTSFPSLRGWGKRLSRGTMAQGWRTTRASRTGVELFGRKDFREAFFPAVGGLVRAYWGTTQSAGSVIVALRDRGLDIS